MSRISIVEYGIKAADEFMPHPYNAKVHPVYQQTVIRQLVNDLGYILPVIESARTGYLIDGHERVFDELKQNPPGFVPYVRVDLDESQEALALASLDASGRLAIYDAAAYTNLREKMKNAGEAVAELTRRIQDEAVKFAPLDEQRPPPVPVRAGDVFRVGTNRVHVLFINQIPALLSKGAIDGVVLEPSTAAYVFDRLKAMGTPPVKDSK